MKKFLFLLMLVVMPLVAQEPPIDDQSAASKYFGEIVLTDQHGKRIKLYDELMKGRTVVMHSFFATCEGSCPVMGRTYTALQQRFADRLGKDLILVSITVDPTNDTPPKLLQFAKNMKARPGWYLFTGSQEEVTFALKKIGQYVDAREAHMNLMVIGNDRTGLWKKAFGLAQPDEIAKVVESVLNDKGA